jgi:predicted branched-subunit amino acid permease
MSLNETLFNFSENCTQQSFFLNLRTSNYFIWSLISIIGILANGTVLAVIFLQSKLSSATQYFIVNLALSDLLFLAICPIFLMINYQTGFYKYLPLILGNIIIYFCIFLYI